MASQLDYSEYQRLQRTEAEYQRLLTAIEALRAIPAWATIQLGTDDPCCPYNVFIEEGSADVGKGERVIAVSGDDLIAVLEQAFAEYLLWNREYALKREAALKWGKRRLKELGLLDDEETGGG